MDEAEIRAAVRERVKSYVVSMMTGDRLLGSGTLVERNGRYGILTAWHVFFAPTGTGRGQLREPFGKHPATTVSIGYVTDIPHNSQVEFQHLQLVGTGDVWEAEEWGPDLLFVQLPQSPQLQSIRAKKSFFALGGTPPRMRAPALESDYAAWCFAGTPDLDKHDLQPSHGFDRVVAIPAKVAFGAPRGAREHNGWDYLDVPVTMQSPEIPASFGGVSGGGLWKTPYVMNGPDKMENVAAIRDPVLCGVVFYEYGRSQPDRFVRCHGPKSIYDRLCSKIDDH